MTIGARTMNGGAFNKVSLSIDSSSSPEPVQPCTIIQGLTVRQALDQKFPIPWAGSVIFLRPEELTMELFAEMEAYGLNRQHIKQQLGIKYDAEFYRLLNNLKVGKKSADTKKDWPKQRSLSQCAAGKPHPFLAADEMPIPLVPVEAEPVLMPQHTLIDVAGSLIDAVNRRDEANRQIKFYIDKIQRMATGGTQ